MNRIPFAPTRNLICCLLALACIPRAAAQDGGDEPGRSVTESPYFQVLSATEPGVDALPLKDTQVDVLIAGVIAEVTVTQTYANAGAIPLEAKYVFPGSTRAAVHALTMVVGDRVVRAQIKTKDDARRTYEVAKVQGKTAALLEQHRPNVFEMNLANILPREEVRVELHYTELLVPEEGQYQFVYPTVVGPRYVGDHRELSDDAAAPRLDESWTATPYLKAPDRPAATFGFNLDLAAGVPIAQIACSTHPVRIQSPTPDRATLTLDPAADPTSFADRDVIVAYRLAGGAIQAGLITSAPDAHGNAYFLAMIQPPARIGRASIPPRDYVFIVDVSGSMHGFPLETAKQLLAGLISSIRPTDTFNLVLFAGSAATLAGSPLPATPENLARAIVLLEREPGGGGTELLPALRTGLTLPRPPQPTARTFVVVTDGYVAVEAEAFDLVRTHLDQANVFAFGIGGSVNRHLIEGLARAGQGEPFVVTNADDAAATAARFREYIETPALTHVQLAFEGIDATEITPAGVPDVFAQRPVIVFGRWRGSSAGRLRLDGTTGDGPFQASLEFAQATSVGSSRSLELLWTRARIRALEDDELEGRDPARVSAITRLGLEHGLLTRHTSFVAVDEMVRTDGAQPVAVKQPVPLPAGVSSAAVGGQEIATTPEPATIGLLTVTLALLAWTWWRTRAQDARHGA